MKTLLLALATVAEILVMSAAQATPIEPRSLTWNIVSDREMSRLCRDHGLRPNCEGMVAWDGDDVARWQVIHHELQHCQHGQFHH